MSDYRYGSAVDVDFDEVEGETDIEASDAPIELDAEGPAQRPVLSSEPASDLASLLREEFGTRSVPTTEVPIPGRPGWALVFRTDWSEISARRWAAKARERVTKENPSGVNLTKLYMAQVIDQCVDITRAVNGRQESILRPGPYRKVLASPELIEALEESRPEGVVRSLLPVFPQLQHVAQAMNRASGEGEGPTEFDDEIETGY